MIETNKSRFPDDSRQLVDRLRLCPVRAARADDADILSAVSLIVERRQERLAVANIANALSISRSTLERRFRDLMGISVGRTITLVRLEIARHFLAHTALTITEVSEEAGFASPAQMSNVFRRELNCSPRNFRQANSPYAVGGRASVPTLSPALEELMAPIFVRADVPDDVSQLWG